MRTYHIVSNELGVILAVYGEALLSEAQSKAKYIQTITGGFTYIHTVTNKKQPHVGQSISMRNVFIKETK
jgi:hypothetical protein